MSFPARRPKIGFVGAFLWGALVLIPASLPGQQTGVDLGGQLTVSPRAYADAIEKDLTELRGLPFKKEIDVQNQSMEDFEKYMDKQLMSQLPADKQENLGTIIQVVGLHRGPEIDYVETVKLLMGTQAAAYYDPETSAFYVVKSDMPEVIMGGIYAHELYHGLQDQYFDLKAYYTWDKGEPTLNDDEMLARQSVVEGEAMYIMQMWTVQEMLGMTPDPSMLQMSMQQMSSMLEQGSLRSIVRANAASGLMGSPQETAEILDQLETIPQFMIDTLMGAYLRGMIFVADVHRGGWPAVEQLYKQPPASSEMILHPEKWRRNEIPYRIDFGDLEAQPALKGWEDLEQNTLGEVQMGIVFSQYGLPDVGKIAAYGWDGDRYAVLRHRETGEKMLLLHTAWDSPAEAEEFAGAYAEVARVKDSESGRVSRIEHDGASVYVVEAPPELDAEPLLEIVRSALREK